MVYYSTGPSADYDGDGRVDLFLVNWFRGNHSRLMRNDSPPRNWLDVEVRGRDGINRMGIGSQVRVYRAGRLGDEAALVGLQEVTIGYGYGGGQTAVCHFGLGNIERVDLSIRLPGGKVIEQRSVSADRRIVVE